MLRVINANQCEHLLNDLCAPSLSEIRASESGFLNHIFGNNDDNI